MTTYSVMDIARFIVCKYIGDGNPVTNMKLQKMLYYAWVEHYRRSGTCLFEENICAWRFGPIVPEVYREYRIFAGLPIFLSKGPCEIDEDTKDFLTGFADGHSDFTASGLVNLPNREGYPWERICKGDRKYTEIPFDTIVAIECHGWVD